MPDIPFSDILSYLEGRGYTLVRIHSNRRMFFKPPGRILWVEVSDKHVSAIDFKTIRHIVEGEEGNPRGGRRRL